MILNWWLVLKKFPPETKPSVEKFVSVLEAMNQQERKEIIEKITQSFSLYEEDMMRTVIENLGPFFSSAPSETRELP